MEVCLYAEKYKYDIWYKGCTLQLPAHQMALEDAMQRARISDGEEYTLEILGDWPAFLYGPLEQNHATLAELNLLAFKLSQMSQEEKTTYEGILQSIQEGTIKNLINAAYNLDHFEFLPGIMNEEELGEVSIENDLLPALQNLPETVYPLLSPERVGVYVKEQEHGVFTPQGYCYRSSEEWVEPYDGIKLPEQMEAEHYIFHLHLQSPETGRETRLVLPYDEINASQCLERLGIKTFRGCVITQIHSSITQFEYSLNKAVEVERMNHLATELATLSPKELIKYKAITAYQSCDSLEQAMELYYTMDRYTFDPIQVTFATYGRECLREGGADLEAEAFRNFNFESYGKSESRRSRLCMTPYGAISYESPQEMEAVANMKDPEVISGCNMQMEL